MLYFSLSRCSQYLQARVAWSTHSFTTHSFPRQLILVVGTGQSARRQWRGKIDRRILSRESSRIW